LRAFIYARYSSNNQREESITAQLEACRDHCKREGLEVVRIFTDEAESAKSDDRPGFQDMIDVVSWDPVDFVVVHKLDRFARNRYDAAFYRRKLRDKGARLVSVLEPLDNSPESVILESVLEGMAEYYSKNLAREVMKGMRQTALQGLWCGGKPPVGYLVGPDRKLVIEPSGAAIVKRIFELFLSGYGYKAIAVMLNTEGYVTATGGPWYKSSIHTILTNEKYTGVYVFNLRASAREDGSRNNHEYKDAEDVIRIEGVIPPIVERETWERVRDKMDNRKKGPQPRRRGGSMYLLTGFAFCGECGGAIVGGGTHGKGDYYYTCTRKVAKACANPTISRNWLEGRVLEEMKSRVFSVAAVDSLVPMILDEVSRRSTDGAEELNQLRAKIKDAQTKISRLIDLVEDGSAGADIKSRIESRRVELNGLRERESFLLDQTTVKYTEDMIRAYLLAFRVNLESEDPGLKRKAVEAFVDRVDVFSDRVDIRFRVDPVDKVGGGDPHRTLSPHTVDKVGGGGPLWTLSTALKRAPICSTKKNAPGY
jgi:site-specific DNA recombinase